MGTKLGNTNRATQVVNTGNTAQFNRNKSTRVCYQTPGGGGGGIEEVGGVKKKRLVLLIIPAAE